jgi:hypothetical protein
MRQTISAISIVALFAGLAGPPATAQDNAPWALDDTTEIQFNLDLGSVFAAGSDRLVDESFLADAQAGFELESYTEQNVRWGLVVQMRAELDSGRRGWGGRSGDCPPGIGDCPSVFDGVSDRPLMAATSGLHTAGPAGAEDWRFATQAAYVFVDTGWGDVRLGYGSGAADLDAEKGPTAFRLARADGGRVDLTGLSGARTRNLTSGFSPKLSFRSIELGQVSTVGLGRLSVSYTPEVRDCGVDFCAQEYGPAGLLSPLSDNVWEIGAHYAVHRGDNEFALSLGISRSSDATGRAGFEGVSTEDIGLSWRNGSFSAGLRGLTSNNGVSGSLGYQAWSGSVGYEAGPWISVIEYASFSDDLAHTDGETLQMSASRFVGDHWIMGLGVQKSRRDEPYTTGLGRVMVEREATAAFVELGWQF